MPRPRSCRTPTSGRSRRPAAVRCVVPPSTADPQEVLARARRAGARRRRRHRPGAVRRGGARRRPSGCGRTATPASSASWRARWPRTCRCSASAAGMQLMTVRRRRPAAPAPARAWSGTRGTGPSPGSTASTPYASTPGSRRRPSSADACACSRTTTRASPTPGTLTVTGWAEDDGTVEAVEDPATGSPSACCGTPRSATTRGSSTRSSLPLRTTPGELAARTSGGRRSGKIGKTTHVPMSA